MKKKILFRLAGVLIVGFIIMQMLFVSIFDANLVIDFETSWVEKFDSITIECYVDNKLVIDTIAYGRDFSIWDNINHYYTHIILPLQVKTKNHSLFFIVDGHHSKVIKFNSRMFTFIEVLYSEYNGSYQEPYGYNYFEIIKIKKNHFKYFWLILYS